MDNAVIGVGKKRVMTYVKNAQGQVLHREDFTEGGQLVRYRDFFFANSRQIGDLSNDGPSREDYVQAQASQKAREADKDTRNRQPVAAVDFDQNYEPISATYPGNAASFYTAQAGGSLRAIAQAVWGDGAMWYLIAEANGYDADVSLRGGEVIEIPNKVANIHHNASTVRVYNPGEALGNTQPTLPDPPPPPPQPPARRGGCGGIAKIIMIAVAVVVTIYTAGAASAAIGSMMTAGSAGAMGTVGAGLAASSASMSFGALAVGGAVGAAAGSAASQLVGMALGEVDKFSWSAVGNAAIIGGISGGIGSLGAGGSVARALGASSWAATAISAGVNTTISQGLMSAAGAGNFSWRNVAASAIAAPITQSIGDSIFGTVNQATGAVTNSGAAWAQGNETAVNLVNNFLGGSINQLARATVYGRSDSWRDAGLNVLGETLGNGVAGSQRAVLTSGLQQYGLSDEEQETASRLMRQSGVDSKDPSITAQAAQWAKNAHNADLPRSDRLADYRGYLTQFRGLSNDQADVLEDIAQRNFKPRLFSVEISSIRVVPANELIDATDSYAAESYFGGKISTFFNRTGGLATEIGQQIEQRPWLKYGLEGIDLLAGPVVFAARKALAATPVSSWLMARQTEAVDWIGSNSYNPKDSLTYAQQTGMGGLVIAQTAVLGAGAAVKGVGAVSSNVRTASAQGIYRGGSHSQTRLPFNDGLDSHHMPADSISPIPRQQGPAIQMDPLDHRATSSYGGGLDAIEYRAQIKGMLDGGNMRKAMATEIWDVRRVTRDAGVQRKYNGAIQEMLRYSKNMGQLEKQGK